MERKHPNGLVVSTKAAFPEASGASGGENSYLTALSETAAGDNGLWIPTKYTGVDKYGLTRSVSGDFIAGEQVTVTAVSWSTVPGVNRQNIYVHSNYTNVATSTMNTSTAKMTMDIHDEGAIRVIYDICYDGSSVPVKSFQDIWNSELPFDEGTYFFENVEEEQYMQIDDDDSSNNYSTNLAKLELKDATKEEYQKWKVIHVSDGYYKILSIKSGLAVSVQSGCVDEEEYLVQETYSGLPRQLWNFEYDTEVEAYIVRPKSAINADIDWCMCGENGNFFSSELDVLQSDHIDNNSYLDYWNLIQIDDYFNMFVGRYEGHINMLALRRDVESYLNKNAKLNGKTYNFQDNTLYDIMTEEENTAFRAEMDAFNKEVLIEMLKEVTMFTCVTHGLHSSIGLSGDGELTSDDVNSISPQLDNLKFVYLGACLTGEGGNTSSGQDNLVNAFKNAGVTTVLGYTTAILDDELEIWTEYFLMFLSEGQSVSDAVASTDDYIQISLGKTFKEVTAENRYMIGDGNIIPCTDYEN